MVWCGVGEKGLEVVEGTKVWCEGEVGREEEREAEVYEVRESIRCLAGRKEDAYEGCAC